jgi:hypothetical protein
MRLGGGYLIGSIITVLLAAVAWFVIRPAILDRIDESNARSGGGGPPGERIVHPRQFGPIVAKLRRAADPEAQLVSVTLRPLSAEFVVAERGSAVGYRWTLRGDRFQTFQPGPPMIEPWPLRRLDVDAPQRITRAISAAEDGDFLLTLGTLERASSGKLVWVMRGRVGEDRGVAYSAEPNGSRVKSYDPSSPELSAGARLAECIRRAAGDPQRLQRCAERFAP